jgi:hypothetical protein
MQKRWICCAMLTLPLAACVTNSGIQRDGPDGYRLMELGKTGFSSSGKMKIELYQQADAFCSKKGLGVETIAEESQQAHAMGGFPEASLRFRCVAQH